MTRKYMFSLNYDSGKKRVYALGEGSVQFGAEIALEDFGFARLRELFAIYQFLVKDDVEEAGESEYILSTCLRGDTDDDLPDILEVVYLLLVEYINADLDSTEIEPPEA